MKEEEKEEQRALREQMKEEALVQKEIENQKRKLKKEELQFKNELLRLKSTIPEDENDKLEWEQKINSIEEKLALLSKDLDDVLNREQNTRAGHVYIISNIGSFGENIYKIGVTRRLDPTERINELSSASVPFKYDIHATIFSEDAPKLESALHKAFDNKRVNKVNNRKEFFKVTLDEIRTEVEKNFDKTVEYTKLAEAQEYRQTLKIQELNKKLA
ncbi:GIY-YIG nuclease family protein [Clostridioides difficile]|nr:GIY-YIG nuclease family protein [Clostridioides difficile]